MRQTLYFIFLLVTIGLNFSTGSAQTASVCTLKGTVRAPPQEIDVRVVRVPNIEIMFTNKDIVRKATTTDIGEYSLTLPPGIYTAKVDAWKGFEPTYRSEIKVDPCSSKNLNFKIYIKVPVFWEWSGAHRKGADHPSIEYVNFTYEEIPNLSETGVRSGMVRFTEKCQTQTLISYNGRSIANANGNVTFTYDFFTVTGDYLHINTKTKEIFALGNLEIEKDGEYLKYDGIIKINVKDGKVSYEKVDTSEMY